MNRVLTTPVVAASQLAMVGLAVAPQLSARLTGDTYLMRVAPVDPIDPFRGAYVTLDYPDLHDGDGQPVAEGRPGPAYVTLRQEGDTWVADGWSRQRPAEGPYLACDDSSWDVRCGIESWFLPQDEAKRTEQLLRDGAVAEVRIDSRGHAAVVGVRAP
jgi:uncharacterized membrane-anchored protein